MSRSTGAIESGLTLLELLDQARRSESSSINADTIVDAFRAHGGSPHREKPYFKEERGLPLSRREELLAKELKAHGLLSLPHGDELRLLDYQVPLKAVQSDRVGKIDLVGVTGGNRLTLVELKIGESTENPRIALLELLAYWAVVKGNLDRINRELSQLRVGPHEGPGRLLIIAPTEYWRRWREPKRKHRWLEFCRLLDAIKEFVDADIQCLALRFALASVSIGMEDVFVAKDGTITDEGFFDDL
jgi:hypothetical protein